MTDDQTKPKSRSQQVKSLDSRGLVEAAGCCRSDAFSPSVSRVGVSHDLDLRKSFPRDVPSGIEVAVVNSPVFARPLPVARGQVPLMLPHSSHSLLEGNQRSLTASHFRWRCALAVSHRWNSPPAASSPQRASTYDARDGHS